MEKSPQLAPEAPAAPKDGASIPVGDAENRAENTAEQRAAPRLTLLIRAAKLVSSSGEFVCIVRDVSDTGVSVRLFHAPPQGDDLELHMPGGARYALQNVWSRGTEAGFEFPEPVDVTQVVSEAGDYPKRGLRIDLRFPIRIRTATGDSEAVIENLSQQGARFESDARFAIDQNLRLESAQSEPALADVRAKVRWRRDNRYGAVFDDTFTLANFARFVARAQAPDLLE